MRREASSTAISCSTGRSPKQGRYPPIDPLASVSRLAPKAWRGDEQKLVSRLKALIHRYEETSDLRLIGGYRPGSDPDLDMAVKQVPVIYEVLKQAPGEGPAADAFDDLARAMKAAAGIAEPPGQGGNNAREKER